MQIFLLSTSILSSWDTNTSIDFSLDSIFLLKSRVQSPVEADVPDVAQCRRHVREYLAIHLLPTPAEGVVLREVPAAHGVDHTIHTGVILVQVLVLVVVHALKLGVLGLHLRENLALDAHEAGRAVQNLHESVSDRTVCKLEIHHETRAHLVWVLGLASLDPAIDLVPHDALLGVAGHSDIVPRLDETHDRLGVEMDIRIDEEKVGRLRLLHEACDGEVTRTMHERLVLCRVEHHLDTLGRTETLETQDRLGIGREADSSITGSTYK